MKNELEKNKDRTEDSMDQITSLPDFYKDFRPEETNEIFFTESTQRDRSIYHKMLTFCVSLVGNDYFIN